MDASLTSVHDAPAGVIESSNRTSPDFVMSEVVTTSSGHRVRAVFGEISEKVTTTQGWKVRGVFYE